MPMYRFQCDQCGTEDLQTMTFDEHDEYKRRHPNGHVVPHLGCITGIFKQVFGVNVNLGMREHFSDQLGTNVTSDRDFNNTLKRQAEEYSARTGMEVSYDVVDPTDPGASGVTDAGLESQERAHHDASVAVGEHTVRSFT